MFGVNADVNAVSMLTDSSMQAPTNTTLALL